MHINYYVSYYTEYPVYHPEEGGYYESCVQLDTSYKFGSLKNARKFLAKWAEEMDMERWTDNRFGISSKYVGEGSYIRIETVMGIEERGCTPYC